MGKRGPKPRTDEQFKRHFWSRVDKDEDCWLWTGAKDSNDYGLVGRSRRMLRVHRVAWEFTYGRPIPEGLCVLHRCDNPPCVNPDHLFLGTKADNHADSVAKNRHSFGERNGMAKLTFREVRFIRKAYAAGLGTHRKLADRFGVSQDTIWKVVRRKSWKSV